MYKRQFPYGGHRFEFRAVGSAQNVSLVNTVLNTITANAFKEVADRIEGGETAQAVAADLINTHVPKVVFNGDNYDEANQEMLTKRGVWRIDSGVDAICRYSDPKNTALFAPGEAVRMMTCFGTKDALMNLMPARLREPPATAAGVAERSLLLAAALGPAVAVVETSVSLATETATLLNAQAAGEGSLHEAMALAMRPAYLSRCWVALLAKNVLANSTTFFFMFAADFASNA